MARILDGTALAQTIREEVRQQVAALAAAVKQQPGLAVVLVGEDPASRVYVNQKKKACTAAGIFSLEVSLPGDVTQEDLLQQVRALNADARIHGILVQMPLPKHLDELAINQTVDPAKDVDGFNPINLGLLALGKETFVSCTPLGVMEILKRNHIQISGKKALVVGRSNIVGKPMAQLLLQENATVTVAHSRTRDLPHEIGQADILVGALGKPEFIKGEWIKSGAVVIDVGINSIPDPASPKGYRLIGDVEFVTAEKRASSITPVPGGVGPMTIAMLLVNTLKAYERSTVSSPPSADGGHLPTGKA